MPNKASEAGRDGAEGERERMREEEEHMGAKEGGGRVRDEGMTERYC